MPKGVIIDSSVVEHESEIRYALYYEFEEQPNGVVEKIVISGSIKTLKAETGFQAFIGLSNQELTLKLMLMLDPMAICLASCFVGISVKVILQCFSRDVRKFIDCLRSKALKIGPDLGSCIAVCIAPI